MLARTGQLIGDLRVVRPLGEGAMGEVFEAVHEQIGQRVAVKVLRPEVLAQPGMARRFLNEARAVSLIRHPGVIYISGCGTLPDGAAYLVMELLDGQTLKQRLQACGQLPLLDALRLARQLAAALAVAHERGVVHRDLKPANIMIVADGEVAGGERCKILDFGIAKLSLPSDGDGATEPALVQTGSHALLGTPAYMSPEQCRGARYTTDPVDVYALGVMLYEMLSGQRPFWAPSATEVMYQQIHQQPLHLREVAPAVPRPAAELVHAMLAKEPGARPSMAEVAAALEGLLSEPPPPAADDPDRTGGALGALDPVPQATAQHGGRAKRVLVAGGAAALALTVQGPLPHGDTTRIQQTSVFGRVDELGEILARFGQGRRLVTIIGPGGVGKTTLAQTALAQMNLRLDVVELVTVERPEGVAGAVAAHLGYPSFEVLLASPALRGRVVLVDNCEHVLTAAAEAIEELLKRCDGVSVLATSRSPLDVPGESIVALGPLPLPRVGETNRSYASMRLLEERARDAGVAITEDELGVAGELCRRLDGVPLAIELAAARLRTKSLRELVACLSEGIDLLARPRHRGAAHQRSVRGTIDWSLALLDDTDRAAFGWLGLCPGWFDVELAAAAVGTATSGATPIIERLVDASLLVVDHHVSPTRYRMLQPLRAVALDLLTRRGGRADGLERMASHLVDQIRTQLEHGRRRLGADAAAAAIDRFDQIDLTLRHCIASDRDPRRARVLYAVLWGIVQQARLAEVLDLGEMLFNRWPDLAGPHGADAASVLATAKLFDGDISGARALARAALAHEQDSLFASVTLRRALGHAARFERDHQAAAGWFAAAAQAGLAGGVPTLAIASLAYQAQDLAALGRADDAVVLVRRAISEAGALGSPLTELFARTVEASLLATGDGAQRAAAAELAAANLTAAQAGTYPVGVLANLQTLTACHLHERRVRDAARAAAQLVAASTRAGPGELRRALELAAAVLAATGDDEARHLSATAAILPDTSPMTLGVQPPALERGVVLDRAEAQRRSLRQLERIATPPTPIKVSK